MSATDLPARGGRRLPRHHAAPARDVTVFRIDGLDRIGIPVVQANLILPDEPATTGYGYGFTEEEAAVGALGELCEEVHVGTWLARAPRVVASYAELARARGARGVVDPLTLCLPAGSAYTPEMPLSWVEGAALALRRGGAGAARVGRGLPLPARARPARLITPITNGLGAGFDLRARHRPRAAGAAPARRQRRHLPRARPGRGGGPRRGGGARGRGAARPPARASASTSRSKLACTDFGLSNLYVVGDDRGEPRAPIQVTACGEAAHPDRARAPAQGAAGVLRLALPQGGHPRPDRRGAARHAARLRRAADRRRHARARRRAARSTRWRTGSRRTRPSCAGASPAPSSPSAAACRSPPCPTPAPAAGRATARTACACSADRLAAEGLEPIWVDSRRAGTPVKVVKAIVPGLESETMSYDRIGWRGVRRLRERGDPLLLDGAARRRASACGSARRTRRGSAAPPGSTPALADRMVGRALPALPRARPLRRAAPPGATPPGRGLTAGAAALRLQHQRRREPPPRRRRRPDRRRRLRRRRAHPRPPPPRPVRARLGARARRRSRARLRRAGLGCVVETGARFLLDPRAQARADPGHAERRGPRPPRRLPAPRDRHRRHPRRRGGLLLGRRAAARASDRGEAGAWLRDGVAQVLEHAERRGVAAALEPEPGMLVETLDDWVAAARATCPR